MLEASGQMGSGGGVGAPHSSAWRGPGLLCAPLARGEELSSLDPGCPSTSVTDLRVVTQRTSASNSHSSP